MTSEAIQAKFAENAKEFAAFFCWCVEHLQKFPPMEGEWLDEVKRRLRLADAYVAERDERPITWDWLLSLGGERGTAPGGNEYVDFIYDTVVCCDEQVCKIILRVHSPFESDGACMVDLFDADEGSQRGIGLTKNWHNTRGGLLRLCSALGIELRAAIQQAGGVK